MKPTWLHPQRTELAAERILDAAADLYERRGVAQASMEEVAQAAGCSRATLYRYFDGRQGLQVAFVHRETRRIAALVAADIAGLDDPAARVVEGALGAIAQVRARPALLAWFAAPNTDVTHDIVSQSPVIHHLAAGLIIPPGDDYRARWLVRAVLSLLLMPGADAAEERALLERFVAPVVVGPGG